MNNNCAIYGCGNPLEGCYGICVTLPRGGETEIAVCREHASAIFDVIGKSPDLENIKAATSVMETGPAATKDGAK